MEMTDLEELLQAFMLTNAPSGYEKDMAYRLMSCFSAFHSDVRIDRVGNVIATIPGTDPRAPSVMVFGHMDQLGMITRKVEKNGYLQIERLGGIPEKVLPGLRVAVRGSSDQWIPGIIGSKSHHAAAAEEKYRAEPITSLFVDIGAAGSGQVRAMGIEIGAPIVYAPSFTPLMNNLVSGTSIDNRGACAVLGDLAKRLSVQPPRCSVYLVGTVWEEYNLRGACLAARKLKPDIAICLDVALSGDTPDLAGRFDNALGAGPVLSMYSFHGRGTLNGVIPHPGLVALTVKTAADCGIPLQRFASIGLLTDNAYTQLENEGIACMDLAFSARYTHTPIEVCSVSDLQLLSDLLCAVLGNLTAGFSLNRY